METNIGSYGLIKYKIYPRKKLYEFTLPYLKRIQTISEEIVPKYIARYIFGSSNNTFRIPEFGLLELEYILTSLIENNETYEKLELAAGPINDLLKYLKEETWLQNRYNKVTDIIDYKRIEKKMKFKILPNQKPAFTAYETIKQIANLRGSMIDAAPGVGKTFISLSLSEGLGYEHTLIIAPRQTLEKVWVKSVSEELYKKEQTYQILDGKTKKLNNVRFYICHYEYLEKLVLNKTLSRQLKKFKPNIIIDEFHNFNNINSKRTNSLLKLINYLETEDVVLLTGTPIKFTIDEFKPLLYVLDKKFPSAITYFSDLYKSYNNQTLTLLKYRFNLYRERIEKDTSNTPPLKVEEYKLPLKDTDKYLIKNIQEDMTKYKNERHQIYIKDYDKYETEFNTILEYAKNKLAKHSDKIELNRVFNQYLKEVKEIFNLVESRKTYLAVGLMRTAKAFEENYVIPNISGDMLKRFRFIASIVKYPILKAMGEALGKILLRRRIDCYAELATSINYRLFIDSAKKKTIIFSNYIKTCEIAIAKTKRQGFKPLAVYGDKTSELSKIVGKFSKKDSIYNPLIATYKSLSTGVPLTTANVMVCLDMPFRMYLFDQAVSRMYRLGQDQPTFVYIVKLDTGEEVNITQRDLYILNLSKERVEIITDNEFSYDIPEEPRSLSEEDNPDEEIIEEEILDSVKSSITDNVLSNFFNSNLFQKIKIKLV